MKKPIITITKNIVAIKIWKLRIDIGWMEDEYKNIKEVLKWLSESRQG